MVGKVVASFAQAQQLTEHTAKGREVKHPLVTTVRRDALLVRTLDHTPELF